MNIIYELSAMAMAQLTVSCVPVKVSSSVTFKN